MRGSEATSGAAAPFHPRGQGCEVATGASHTNPTSILESLAEGVLFTEINADPPEGARLTALHAHARCSPSHQSRRGYAVLGQRGTSGVTGMRTTKDAERSPWRWPASAAALVAAAAHVPITGQHLSEAPYIGWSFVALEITLAAVATALVLRDTPVVWWAAGVVPALAIGAYAVTRTVALPQIADDVGDWTQPLGVVAVTAEALLLLISLTRRSSRGRSWVVTRRPVLWASLLLVVGLAATTHAAAAGGG